MINTIDYTNFFPGSLIAEGRGRNILILSKLDKPLKRFDGKQASYELEYRELSQNCRFSGDEAYACMLSNEFTYWQNKEIKEVLSGRSSLLDLFHLF